MSGRGYNQSGWRRDGNTYKGRNFQNNSYGNTTSGQDSLVGKTQNLSLNDDGKFLFANHFAVSFGKTEEVYDYELTFTEEGKAATAGKPAGTNSGNVIGQAERSEKVPNVKKKRLVCLLFDRLRLRGAVATDFVTRIISLHPLEIGSLPQDNVFEYYDEYQDRPAANCKRYTITIGEPTVVSFRNLLASLSLQGPRGPSDTETEKNKLAAVEALNIIFSFPSYCDCFPQQYPPEIPRMTTSNGHYFYGVVTHLNQETATGPYFSSTGGLYSIPGFSRSVRTVVSAKGNIDLNINTTTANFWQHSFYDENGVKQVGTVQDIIEAWTEFHYDSDHSQLDSFLKGLPVRVLPHINNIDKFGTIRGLDHARDPQIANACHMKLKGVQNNLGMVNDYYYRLERWEMDHNIYVVLIGKDDPNTHTTIPANRLEVLPGRVNRSQAEKPSGAIRPPRKNYQMITNKGWQTFCPPGAAGEGGATDFGLSLDHKMAQVSVKIVDPPALRYGRRHGPSQNSDNPVSESDCRNGSWMLKDVSFVRPARGKRWTCFEMTKSDGAIKSPINQLDKFLTSLEQDIGKYGMKEMRFENPGFPYAHGLRWQDDRLLPAEVDTGSIGRQYEAIKAQLQVLKRKGVNLAVIILPKYHIGLYTAIKQAGDQEVGIATVCHYIRKERPPKDNPRKDPLDWTPNWTPDCLANLCMKINLKLDTNAANQILHGIPDEADFVSETKPSAGGDGKGKGKAADGPRPPASTGPVAAPGNAKSSTAVKPDVLPWSKIAATSTPQSPIATTVAKPASAKATTSVAQFTPVAKPLQSAQTVQHSQPVAQTKSSPMTDPSKGSRSAVLTRRSMIIGIDVTHPGAGHVKGSPSVAACVGSVDPTFSQWPASLKPNVIHDPDKESREEVVELTDMIFERLVDYYERNKQTPDQLIVYRDGVSESQFSMCAHNEYTRICNGVDKLYEAFPAINVPKPKIVLICAVKRNQTRLFPDPVKSKQAHNPIIGRTKQGDNENPLPGCLVTDRITYGYGQDFFLVSQRAIQGTARPTHYNILVNEPGYTLEQIAETTHHLCYLFGRSSRTVGVCPAIYYADLAADRARCYVRKYYNPYPSPRGQEPPQRQEYDEADFKDCLRLHGDMKKTMFYI
ncbi:Piwi domain-containing protein [Exophiala viscosa]|uniref:Piwi domain-containing protein n=1 Tax=Exophiala viscosa TaxID=2486360 RepID=A0AAN6DKZ6_9EURO|nr:Piwi domain-containing protein [Exophiala viscosa]